MHLGKKTESPELSAEIRNDPADRVLEAERSLMELARQMGLSIEALRRWSRGVGRGHGTASDFEDTLVPSSRVRELEREIEDLKSLLNRQAVQIQILKKQGIL